jgi:hypothetical protein
MPQPMPLSQVLGEPSRRFFFRPWWRATVTVAAGLLPSATAMIWPGPPPEVETWIGPASLLPLAAWVVWGVRRIRRDSAPGAAPSS